MKPQLPAWLRPFLLGVAPPANNPIAYCLRTWGLSQRQGEIVSRELDGLRGEETARALKVAYSTYKTHAHLLLRKCDCEDIKELMLLVLKVRDEW